MHTWQLICPNRKPLWLRPRTLQLLYLCFYYKKINSKRETFTKTLPRETYHGQFNFLEAGITRGCLAAQTLEIGSWRILTAILSRSFGASMGIYGITGEVMHCCISLAGWENLVIQTQKVWIWYNHYKCVLIDTELSSGVLVLCKHWMSLGYSSSIP